MLELSLDDHDWPIFNCLLRTRKYQKNRSTFLACCLEESTDKLPLFFIAKSASCAVLSKGLARSSPLSTSSAEVIGTGLIPMRLAQLSNVQIQARHYCKVLLLVKICSAHKNLNTLYELSSVRKQGLPPNKTSFLQCAYFDIIAEVRVWYKKHNLEHCVDLIVLHASAMFKEEY